MNNIVILGATGFIGKHLLLNFTKKNFHVKILLQKPINILQGSIYSNSNVETYIGNISDVAVLKQLLCENDIVFNLASPSTPGSSVSNPSLEINEHILPQVKLIQLASEIGVGKIIYFSSGGGIYGKDNSDPISELEVIHPTSPHAISKAAIEYYIQYFGSRYNVPYIIYRVSNPYGPGQVHKPGFGLIPTLFSCVLNNSQPVLFDNGHSIRDFIYISDLIDGISTSYDKQCTYTLYNIGSGLGTETLSIWNEIKNITQTTLVPDLRLARDFDVRKNVLDISRLSTEFNWNPTVNLKDGLAETWLWIQQNRLSNDYSS